MRHRWLFRCAHYGCSVRGFGDAGRRRSLVRKWFASVTLLVASLVFLGDGIYVIYALLNGELTARFAAKAALVAGVTALVFAYYRDELND